MQYTVRCSCYVEVQVTGTFSTEMNDWHCVTLIKRVFSAGHSNPFLSSFLSLKYGLKSSDNLGICTSLYERGV